MHKSIFAIVCVFVVCGTAAALNAQEIRGAAYRNGNLRSGAFKSAGVPKMNKVKWNFTTTGGIYSSPTVFDGVCYIGSRDGNVYALNAANGEVKWKFAIKGGSDSSACVVNDVVYIGGNDGNLYALNASTGQKVWNAAVASRRMISPPGYAYGVVFVIGDGDGPIGMDAKTGKKVFAGKSNGGCTEMALTITDSFTLHTVHGSLGIRFDSLKTGLMVDHRTGTSAISTIAVADGVAYLSCAAYCNSANRFPTISATRIDPVKGGGANLWSVPVQPHLPEKDQKATYSSPAIWKGKVYVGCDSGDLYTFDAKNGKPLWNYHTEGTVRSSPSVSKADGSVYFSSDDGHLYAVDGEKGGLLWKHKIETGKVNVNERNDMVIRSSPWIADGVVYIGGADGSVWAIE